MTPKEVCEYQNKQRGNQSEITCNEKNMCNEKNKKDVSENRKRVLGEQVKVVSKREPNSKSKK